MNCGKLISKGTELLKVKAELSFHKGNKSPYFSITGSVYKATKSGKRDMRYQDSIRCGCLHEDILKAYPGMRDLVELHLSDMNGSPMHAVANGWYYLQKPEEFKLEVTARHLRVSLEEAQRIRDNVNTKDKYIAYVESCRDRWQDEAQAAIEKYNLVIVNS